MELKNFLNALDEASKVGEVSLAELINKLRLAAGQNEIVVEEDKKSKSKKHEWVKEYWHITDPDIQNGRKFKENEGTDEEISKIFVPANIEENRHLADKDPKYVAFLKNLPPDLRAKWYEGSWEDIDTENQYYAARISILKKMLIILQTLLFLTEEVGVKKIPIRRLAEIMSIFEGWNIPNSLVRRFNNPG